MSSGHWQNTGMAKFVNDCLYNYNPNDEKSMNPAKWWSLQNGGSLKDTRETINGFPCRLILVNDGETALNEGQQEPTPGNTKDMGVFNFNNDKDNVNTMGLDTDIFPNCISYEVTANSDTSAGAFVPYSGVGYMYFRNGNQTSIMSSSIFTKDVNIIETDGKMKSVYWVSDTDGNNIAQQNTWGNTNITTENASQGAYFFIQFYDANIPTYIIINGNKYVFKTDEYINAIEPFFEQTELSYLQNSFELRYPDAKEVGDDYGYLGMTIDGTFNSDYGLKRVIDHIGNCTDEEFVADFEKYFNKQYVLRYYLLVIVCGMVDNLGKNMMLDTWDGQIWYPRFYDMDTICSYDNSGEIKFDVDIEMAQGYWNTSSSRLWTKVRDLFHDDLVATYKDLRQNNFSYEKFMSYFYGKQISQIPQTYYNKDYDVKYAPYANEYMGKAHGDGYEHLRRWLKRRLIFTDTLFDYAPSYENDKITIRANTLEPVTIEIETYTPVYQHVSFWNGNMEKAKIDGKASTSFTKTLQAATDQEVMIYGGSNIKRLRGISSFNPDSMLIGNASKLVELDISNCPILSVVNSKKANFSPHTYLNKLDISNCPQLGGQLNISNSPLLQEVNALGTSVDDIAFPTSVRNLETLRVPKTVTSLNLRDAGLLYTIEMEEGNNLQNISLTNCNNLTETINFDLTQTPTVLLDNSFNGEEIYMSATTNLTLKNMPSLQRVIFTPNSEYSAFDINNVLNGASYKITTFNNPMMTDFITTAPFRLSYKNGEYGDITPNTAFTANTLDLADTQFQNVKFLCTTDIYNLKVPTTMKNFYCDSAFDIDTDVITDGSYEVIHNTFIEPYTTNYENDVTLKTGNVTELRFDKSNTAQYIMVDDTGRKVEITDGIISTSNDYISVIPASNITVQGYRSDNNTTVGYFPVIAEYNANKEFIKKTSINSVTLTENTYYVLIQAQRIFTSSYYYIMSYEEVKTPNIIPSSANGSLIFNMYSNNTTQPTSTSPYMWDLTGLKLEDFYTYGMNNWVKQDESGNITMPQRMSGYSVRLVNADITPDEYPTMLYPKLIDTTLPITGKLDYTAYNGSSLAWAYAYTTDDVNLSKLEDESNITCDYNKEATLTDAQEAALLSIFDEEVNN